jgi:hypothetical protein
MWRDDWVNGRIRSTGNLRLVLLGIRHFGISFCTYVIFLPEEIIEKENYAALLGLLFPIVGIGLITVAVRKTIQRTKYGDCLFLMDRVPGILGGEVTGTIQFPRGLPSAETLNARLSCIHMKRRRSGKETSTTEEVLWQTEQAVDRLSPSWQHGSQRAAVKFRIPYDASPTGEIDENNSIFWKLEANAAVPGVDFASTFEIPVFKTLASSQQNTEEHTVPRSWLLPTGFHAR